MKAASCGANEAIGALLDRGVRVSLRYFLTRLKVNPDYVDLDNMTGIAWNCFSLSLPAHFRSALAHAAWNGHVAAVKSLLATTR